MILRRNNIEDLSILAANLNLLSEVVPDKSLLEHIYLDLVLCSRKNFVVNLPFDLEEHTAKIKSAKQVQAFFSKLEIVLDAAERAYSISKIDGKEVTPYKLTVHKRKKGFSYSLNYFDGSLKSRDYTQKEIWCHPKFMRYAPRPDE